MVSKKKIRVGIIGPGGVGYTHIDSLKRLENVEIVAIAARNEERAKFYKKNSNFDYVYSDYRGLIDNKQIDVVHITTPNYLHFEQVQYAVEAGKHVICEKPLGMNASETSQLLKLAERKGLVHAINFNFRFFPLVQQAKAICARGELGEIVTIIGGSLSDDFFYPSEYNWRMDPKKGSPSLAVSAIGCHWLDLMQFVSGLKVESVFAEFANIWPVRDKIIAIHKDIKKYRKMNCPLEEYANILLRFNTRAKGNMILSLVAAGRQFDFFFEIIGLQSSVAWNLPDANRLWRGFKGRPNQIISRKSGFITSRS